MLKISEALQLSLFSTLFCSHVWQSSSEKPKVVCKNLSLNFLRVRGKANNMGIRQIGNYKFTT